MKKIIIYSDGACLSNPGPGGYCAILTYKGAEKVVSGGEAHATNNKMELTAAISGLEAVKVKEGAGCEVELRTDSKYVADGMAKGWAIGWRGRNWTKSDKTPAKNPELWERLLAAVERLESSGGQVSFVWIKGHAGHSYNERCDEIARDEASKYRGKS